MAKSALDVVVVVVTSRSDGEREFGMDVVIVVDDDSFGQSFPLAAGFLVGSLLTTNTTAHNGRFWTLCVCGVWAKETQVIYLSSLTERMRPGVRLSSVFLFFFLFRPGSLRLGGMCD